MSVQEILLQLLLGGLLGVTGQGIRVVIGLKKQSDQAQLAGTTLRATFDAKRLSTSLLIGFVAGVLAMIGFTDFDKAMNGAAGSVKETILGIIAAGYAGTDFIEGFISKYMPKTNTTQQQQPNPPTQPPPTTPTTPTTPTPAN
jgi:putative chitinase